MIGNDEPGASAIWQIMSWWLIAKSHSACTRGAIVMQTGKEGISQDFFTQSAGRKWWSCFWESQCSSCRDKPRYPAAVSERSYKKTTSTSVSEIWSSKTTKEKKRKKLERTQALHYMGVEESALLNSVIRGGQMMPYRTGRLFFLWPRFSHKRSQVLLVSDAVYELFSYNDCNFLGWIWLLHVTHQ